MLHLLLLFLVVALGPGVAQANAPGAGVTFLRLAPHEHCFDLADAFLNLTAIQLRDEARFEAAVATALQLAPGLLGFESTSQTIARGSAAAFGLTTIDNDTATLTAACDSVYSYGYPCTYSCTYYHYVHDRVAIAATNRPTSPAFAFITFSADSFNVSAARAGVASHGFPCAFRDVSSRFAATPANNTSKNRRRSSLAPAAAAATFAHADDEQSASIPRTPFIRSFHICA